MDEQIARVTDIRSRLIEKLSSLTFVKNSLHSGDEYLSYKATAKSTRAFIVIRKSSSSSNYNIIPIYDEGCILDKFINTILYLVNSPKYDVLERYIGKLKFHLDSFSYESITVDTRIFVTEIGSTFTIDYTVRYFADMDTTVTVSFEFAGDNIIITNSMRKLGNSSHKTNYSYTENEISDTIRVDNPILLQINSILIDCMMKQELKQTLKKLFVEKIYVMDNYMIVAHDDMIYFRSKSYELRYPIHCYKAFISHVISIMRNDKCTDEQIRQIIINVPEHGSLTKSAVKFDD